MPGRVFKFLTNILRLFVSLDALKAKCFKVLASMLWDYCPLPKNDHKKILLVLLLQTIILRKEIGANLIRADNKLMIVLNAKENSPNAIDLFTCQ
jgi:hypothetical protein